MPKYDAPTLNALTKKIKTYRTACELSKHTCIALDEWDKYLEEYQRGMLDACMIIIEIISEMRNTAVNETDSKLS